MNSSAPYFASISLNEVAYNQFGLDRLYCHITDSNKRAIRYNLSIGYEPTDKVNDKGNLFKLEYVVIKRYL